MPTRIEKVRAFRAMHRPGTPFIMPNVWSPGTARTMAGAGFDAIATTSGGLALDYGVRDGDVGRQASLQVAAAVCAAVSRPVSVIVQAGGEGITARAAAEAGAARISLAGSLARLAHRAMVAAASEVRAGLSEGGRP